MSAQMKQEPGVKIKMVKMISNSMRDSVGEPTSDGYGSQSPPTVIWPWYGLSFRGGRSYTGLAYVLGIVGNQGGKIVLWGAQKSGHVKIRKIPFYCRK